MVDITGSAADETLDGTSGNDTIRGLGGNDIINGLGGNDFLFGGAGNDTINIGDAQGRSTVTLGDGADVINITSLGINVTPGLTQVSVPLPVKITVTDFNVSGDSQDVFQLNFSDQITGWDGLANPFDLGVARLAQVGNDTVLQFAIRTPSLSFAKWGTVATLQGVDATTLTADNFSGFTPNFGLDDYAGDTATTARLATNGVQLSGVIENGQDSDWILLDVGAFNSADIAVRFSSVRALEINIRGEDGTVLETVSILNPQAFTFTDVEFETPLSGTDSVFYLEFVSTAAVGSENQIIYYDVSATPGTPAVPTLIEGDSGNNVLVGTDGNDEIIGQAGDDILNGGTGNDILTGGTGADQFIIGRNSGTNTITDFTVGEDEIVLDYSPYLQWSDITDRMTDFGSFVVIDMGDGTRVQIDGVSASELSVDSFTFGYNHPDGSGPFLPDTYIFDWDDKTSNGNKKIDDDTVTSEVLPDSVISSVASVFADALGGVTDDIGGFIL